MFDTNKSMVNFDLRSGRGSPPAPPMTPRLSAPLWCTDNPNFLDAYGYGCSGWTSYDCSGATSYGYTPEQVLELQSNCPVSCSDITPACIGCTDNPNFVDATGYACSGWTGYDCSTATSYGYTAYQVALLQANCPVSCTEVTPIC